MSQVIEYWTISFISSSIRVFIHLNVSTTSSTYLSAFQRTSTMFVTQRFKVSIPAAPFAKVSTRLSYPASLAHRGVLIRRRILLEPAIEVILSWSGTMSCSQRPQSLRTICPLCIAQSAGLEKGMLDVSDAEVFIYVCSLLVYGLYGSKVVPEVTSLSRNYSSADANTTSDIYPEWSDQSVGEKVLTLRTRRLSSILGILWISNTSACL